MIDEDTPFVLADADELRRRGAINGDRDWGQEVTDMAVVSDHANEGRIT